MSEKYFDICRQICTGKGYDIRNIHWNEFYLFLKEHHLFLTVYDEIKTRVPQKYRPLYETYYFMEKAQIDGYIALAKNVTQYLYSHKMYGFVFKNGFAQTKYIYSNIYKRSETTIEILCDEKNVIPICKMLEEYGFCEEYVTCFNNYNKVTVHEKNMHYLDDTDKIWTHNGKQVIVRTIYHRFTAHQNKLAVENRQTAMVKGFAFPVLNKEDGFHRFYSHILLSLDIKSAMYDNWVFGYVMDFYFYIKNHFGEVISFDYLHLDKMLYNDLLIMLYFVAELIDSELIRNFCRQTEIPYENLHYCYHLNLNLKRAFLEPDYRKKYVMTRVKKKAMNECGKVGNSKIITPYLNPVMNDIWLEYIPQSHSLIINKYCSQAAFGFCHDKDYVYFSLSLLKFMPSLCIEIILLNVNPASDIFQYNIDIVMEDDRQFIYNSDIDGRFIKTLFTTKAEHTILTVQIARNADYILEEENDSIIFFNYNVCMWKTSEKVQPPLLFDRQKHHFHKILMDKYK